jgi:hypothetical protein
MPEPLANDPPVSEAQRRAMYAARAGRSTLGIPASVGEEFVGKDMKPDDWDGLIRGLLKFLSEEKDEPEHAEDVLFNESDHPRDESGKFGAGGSHANRIHELPKGKLHAEIAKASDKVSKVTTALIDAGRGNEKFSETKEKAAQGDPMAKAYMAAHNEFQALVDHKGERDRLGEKFVRERDKAAYKPAADAVLAMDRELYDARGKRVIFHDVIAMDLSSSVRSYDEDGHLHIARSPLSKCNIGEYFGNEIPRADELGLLPGKRYKLFRDPEELRKGAKTCNGKQILIQHTAVSADDHRPDLTVGALGTDAVFDEPYLYNSMMIHARGGIDGIEDDSRREISMSYHYDFDPTPGEYLGEPYDGVMRNIRFNHCALVPAGRAGADVLVADQKPNGEVTMSKIVLTRKGSFLAGAVAAYVLPRLAADASIDVAPFFAGVTAANFGGKKVKIAADIKAGAKLAKDMELDHLPELLDKLEKMPVAEGADVEPNSGLPMTKDEMEAKAKDEAEEEKKKAAKDAEEKLAMGAKDRKAAKDARRAARDAKWAGMKGSMDEKTCAAIDAWTKENDAAEDAAEGDEPEPKKDQEGTPDKKGAMDAAIKVATDKIRADAKDLREAEAFVKDWIGDVTLAHDAAIDVYRTAIKTLKPDLDVKAFDAVALRGMISLIEKPGAKRRRQEDPLAHDAAGATSFEDAFPATKRFA